MTHRPPRSSLLRCALTLALCALASPAARAWGSLLLIDPPPRQASFAAGPSVWILPAYAGSSRSRTWLVPGLDYESPGGFFASTDSGLGWNLSRRADLQAGLRLWPVFGRRASDAPPGIGGVPGRLALEGFVNVQLAPALLLQTGLLAGAGPRRDASRFEIGLTSGLPIGADLLGIGIAASWSNRAGARADFGVTTEQAAASRLAAFDAPAGWQDRSLTLSFEHRLAPHWRLDAQWIGARLIGAATRSPLLQSASQSGATLTLWHEF
ncbi:MAG: MipA/OmpV family protein [Burkholderiales bacterium]|nr:MipA/OmpV family protein [Burkholderiales bacterium]